MKLTDVIAIWDELHNYDTGEIEFCDFENIIDKIVGVENNVNSVGVEIVEEVRNQ